MKVIIYLRFSSDPQERGSSIERQTEIIYKFIATRPDFEVVATFIDDGYSASKGEHLATGDFGRILADVDAGKYRGYVMIVEKMDRFSRMDYEETASYVKRLTKGGVQLYLAASGRLVNPPDKTLDNIILNVIDAWNAEEFVKNLTVNVTRGWKQIMEKAANGRVLTRNVPTWLKVVDRIYNGGKITDPGRIVQVTEENINSFRDDKRDKRDYIPVSLVQEIYRLAGQGVGSENIARQLGNRLTRPNGKNFTRSWIVKTLCNRAVLGEFQLKNGEVIPGYFPPIIDQSDFDAARAQMDAKRKNGNYAGGNRKHSDTADDLLQGLVYDATEQPSRRMYYHPVERGRYYYSARDGRKVHHIRYDTVATKFIHILEIMKKEDWLAIRGMSESAEYLAAKAEYEATLSQLDKTQNHLNLMNSYMEGDNTDKIEIAMRFIKKDETTIETLQARKDELRATLDAATKRSAALYQDEELKSLIREVKANPAMRMRLRAEIQKRVAKIELRFTANQIHGVIRYVNGAEGKEFTIE